MKIIKETTVSMKIRELKISDAPLMLEWMHDEDVVTDKKKDFGAMTLEDCERFIEMSRIASGLIKSNIGVTIGGAVHLAIAGENDKYMGTVSLKEIDKKGGYAELGITLRGEAMGKGYALYAMQEIIKLGLGDMELKTIYWCVDPENIRAVKFYDKNGFDRVEFKDIDTKLNYSEKEKQKYIWYSVDRK